mmetsp:Transcript_23777/g.56730  ORF Transcript_23777/g.56730 Transcript_23777/m.56730 type:complete len:386 (+) Transcript_23777:819-1976(+)
MHVLQRAAQLSHPAEHGELGEGEAGGLPPRDGLLNVAARGELHHDVQIALVLEGAVVHDDVWMRERREDADLVLHLGELDPRHLLHPHLLAYDQMAGAAVAEEHRRAEGTLPECLHLLVLAIDHRGVLLVRVGRVVPDKPEAEAWEGALALPMRLRDDHHPVGRAALRLVAARLLDGGGRHRVELAVDSELRGQAFLRNLLRRCHLDILRRPLRGHRRRRRTVRRHGFEVRRRGSVGYHPRLCRSAVTCWRYVIYRVGEPLQGLHPCGWRGPVCGRSDRAEGQKVRVCGWNLRVGGWKVRTVWPASEGRRRPFLAGRLVLSGREVQSIVSHRFRWKPGQMVRQRRFIAPPFRPWATLPLDRARKALQHRQRRRRIIATRGHDVAC